MDQALLEQVVAWNDELNGLHDELVQAIMQDDSGAAEELRTIIETLESQFRPGPHGDVTVSPTGFISPDKREVACAHLRTNPSGIIIEANQGAERFLNFPTAWLQGQPLLVFVAQTERAGFLRAFLEFKREKLAGVQWLITLQAVKVGSFAVRLDCKPLYRGQRTLHMIDWSFTPRRHSQSRPAIVHAPLLTT